MYPTRKPAVSRPNSYSWYWTETSLQWRPMQRMALTFAFEKTSRISLTCMLVPVQYREYEYGLLGKIVVQLRIYPIKHESSRAIILGTRRLRGTGGYENNTVPQSTARWLGPFCTRFLIGEWIDCGFFSELSRSLYRTFYVRSLVYFQAHFFLEISVQLHSLPYKFLARFAATSCVPQGLPMVFPPSTIAAHPLTLAFPHTFTLDTPYTSPIHFANARKGVSYCVLWLKYLNLYKRLHINRRKHLTKGPAERFSQRAPQNQLEERGGAKALPIPCAPELSRWSSQLQRAGV